MHPNARRGHRQRWPAKGTPAIISSFLGQQVSQLLGHIEKGVENLANARKQANKTAYGQVLFLRVQVVGEADAHIVVVEVLPSG